MSDHLHVIDEKEERGKKILNKETEKMVRDGATSYVTDWTDASGRIGKPLYPRHI